MTESRNAGAPATAELCLPSNLMKPRLRRAEASAYLEQAHGIVIAASTLAKLACIGGGPSYNKAGRIPLYPRRELDAFALARLGGLRRSTSDRGAA